MKRLFLLTIFCLGVVAVGFAQDTVDAVQLKNDGNDALRAKDYKKALELFEKSLANWSEEEQDNADAKHDYAADRFGVYGVFLAQGRSGGEGCGGEDQQVVEHEEEIVKQDVHVVLQGAERTD